MKKFGFIFIFLVLIISNLSAQYYQDFEAAASRPANWTGSTFSNNVQYCPPQENLKSCTSGQLTAAAFLSSAAFNVLTPTSDYYVSMWVRGLKIDPARNCKFKVCLQNQTTLVKTYFNSGNFFDLAPVAASGTTWKQYTFTFPAGLSTTEQYRIRLEADIGSGQRIITDAWESNANINGCSSVFPSVTISLTSGTNPPAGNPMGFDASVTNSGSPTTYVWKQNTVDLNNNLITCNIPTANADDQIQCTVITTVSGCLYSVKSNIVTINGVSLYTWNGFAWSSSAPTGSIGAVITGDYNETSGFQCADLKIFSNAVLNISDVVVVNGTLTNWGNQSNLVVKNGGKLLHNTNNVLGSVESYLTGSLFHYISSPVSSQNVNLYTLTSDGYTNRNFYYYNETNYDSWDASNNWIGNMGWTNQSSGSMAVAIGYSFFYTTHKTYVYTGNLNNGTYVATLTNTTSGYDTKFDGWNLIGNPYPSPVDWDQIIKSGVANSIYFYNGTNYSYYVSSGANEGVGIGANIDAGANGRYIPVGQGFMVKCLIPTGTVEFSNSARTSLTQSFYKSKPNNVLRLKVTKDKYQDETVIRFLKTATDEYDGEFDATKFFVSSKNIPQIYTITNNGNELAINSLKEFDDKINTSDLNITLGFKAVGGQYTISGNDICLDDFPYIYLEDLYEATFVNLRSEDYTFTHNGGDVRNRFLIVFGYTSTTSNNKIENLKIWSFEKSIFITKPNNMNLPQNLMVDVYDLLGKKVFSTSLESNLPNWKITMESKLETGIYLVKLGNYIQKVVIR